MAFSNPVTHLDLLQRLYVECAKPGALPQSTTEVYLQNEPVYRRLQGWLASGWQDIQNIHKNWGFLRRTATFETVDGQAEYSVEDILGAGRDGEFGRWLPKTARSYLTEQGQRTEIPCGEIGYEQWRNSYFYGALRSTRTQPTVVAVGPDKSLHLGPVPKAGYTVYLDYFRSPQVLDGDDDEPLIRREYRMAVVYKAMQDDGSFEATPEVLERGMRKYSAELRKLEREYLPPVKVSAMWPR